MFTIRTRYLKATDTRGSRIRVELVRDGEPAASRVVAYDYAVDNAHLAAAARFADSLGLGALSVRFARETRSGRGNVYALSE